MRSIEVFSTIDLKRSYHQVPLRDEDKPYKANELKHASVEKYAQAIDEALRYWKHFLTGRHFTHTTDQ